MREKSALGLVAFLAVGTSLMLPPSVQAESAILGPDSYHQKTYTLDKGDLIDWNWEVTGEGDLDFWIEDSQGTRHGYLDDVKSSNSWFTVPSDGNWTFTLHNDETSLLSVNVDIDVEIIPVSEAEDVLTLLIWGFTIVGIMVIVIIIVVVWILANKGRPEQPQSPP